ncbi:MAG: PD-(D/E)XK nuclease family protein, partial [Alistipes sp.]|nr:PD-(D/E)XK nuclease family protein [Alistipes sp.]
MEKNVQNALKKLSENAMFKMSLGSKELFHSNFLEFLWNLDEQKFIAVINQLADTENFFEKNDGTEYFLSREKENFDLCIYHEEKYSKSGKEYINPRTKYDLIIENKVKSIPDKKQLDDYKKKSGGQAKYILLSLVENFEDKKAIEKEWKIVHYGGLSNAIREKYGESNIYIKDYCDFIKFMHSLQEEIVPNGFNQQSLWADYDEYKSYRLHDLYIKLRGLKFMDLLKEKLVEKGITFEAVKKAGTELRKLARETPDNKKPDVYINWNVFNAEGQVAVFVYRDKQEIYEIVIQGNHYKHGINYANEINNEITPLDKDKKESRSKIWEKVDNYEFMNDLNYPNKNNKEYCGYDTDCVYRYYKIDEMEWGKSIDSLLIHMVEDVEKLINALDK